MLKRESTQDAGKPAAESPHARSDATQAIYDTMAAQQAKTKKGELGTWKEFREDNTLTAVTESDETAQSAFEQIKKWLQSL